MAEDSFDAFEPLTSKTRTAFLGVCKQSIRDGKRKLEALIEIANTYMTRTSKRSSCATLKNYRRQIT